MNEEEVQSDGRNLLQQYLQRFFEWSPFFALFFMGLTGGIIGSLGGCLFKTIWFNLQLTYSQGNGFVAAASNMPIWQRVLITVASGTLAALLVHTFQEYFTPSKLGPDYGEAIKEGNGRLHLVPSLLKSLLGILIIAGGFTIGREGAMVHFSALCASAVGQFLELAPRKQRLLVACGAAGGFSTAYLAPLAGGIFVCKQLLKNVQDISEIAAVMLAAMMGKLTVMAIFKDENYPLYEDVDVQTLRLRYPDLVFSIIVGSICGLFGGFMIYLFESIRNYAEKHVPSFPMRIWTAGVVVGLLSLWRPEVWGNGYSTLQKVLQGDNSGESHPSFLDIDSVVYYEVFFLRLIAVIATTAVANLPGGVMTPMMTFGAMIGFPLGNWLKEAANLPHHSAVLCVVTGMASLLATTTQAPIISSILVFELTDGYRCLGVTIFASIVSFLVSKNVKRLLFKHQSDRVLPHFYFLKNPLYSLSSSTAVKSITSNEDCNVRDSIEDEEKQQESKSDQDELEDVVDRGDLEHSTKRPVEDFSYQLEENPLELNVLSRSFRRGSDPDTIVLSMDRDW